MSSYGFSCDLRKTRCLQGEILADCFALLFITMTGVVEFEEFKCQLDTHL